MKNNLTKALVVFSVAALVLEVLAVIPTNKPSLARAAAADYFLKIDGVPGESTGSGHLGEIDVLSWSWGVTNSVPQGRGSGGGEGKASFHDFSFVHNVDKASPVLFSRLVSGTHIKEAEITVRRAGQGQNQDYLKYTFTDVIITSLQVNGNGGEPAETISFNFGSVLYKYQAQDGSTNDSCWNIRRNRPCAPGTPSQPPTAVLPSSNSDLAPTGQ